MIEGSEIGKGPLVAFLKGIDPEEIFPPRYLGRALKDDQMSIIHHYQQLAALLASFSAFPGSPSSFLFLLFSETGWTSCDLDSLDVPLPTFPLPTWAPCYSWTTRQEPSYPLAHSGFALSGGLLKSLARCLVNHDICGFRGAHGPTVDFAPPNNSLVSTMVPVFFAAWSCY